MKEVEEWKKNKKANDEVSETMVMNSIGLDGKSLDEFRDELNSFFNS